MPLLPKSLGITYKESACNEMGSHRNLYKIYTRKNGQVNKPNKKFELLTTSRKCINSFQLFFLNHI